MINNDGSRFTAHTPGIDLMYAKYNYSNQMLYLYLLVIY